MTDDARRPGEARIDLDDDDERRRAMIHAARRFGELCAGCGRTLADDEPVWWASFALRGVYGRLSHRRGPVGRECAPTELLRETEAEGTEACAGCGRGVHYGAADRPRDLAVCSRWCRSRSTIARNLEDARASRRAHP